MIWIDDDFNVSERNSTIFFSYALLISRENFSVDWHLLNDVENADRQPKLI